MTLAKNSEAVGAVHKVSGGPKHPVPNVIPACTLGVYLGVCASDVCPFHFDARLQPGITAGKRPWRLQSFVSHTLGCGATSRPRHSQRSCYPNSYLARVVAAKHTSINTKIMPAAAEILLEQYMHSKLTSDAFARICFLSTRSLRGQPSDNAL